MEATSLRSRIRDLENRVGSMDHYSELFKNAPVGYLILDGMGLIHDSNLEMRRMLDWPPHRPLHGPFLGFVAKEKVSDFLTHLHEAKDHSTAIHTDLILRQKSGSCFPVEIISLPITNPDGTKGLATIVVAIPHRKAVEEALNRTQHDFQMLMDTVQGILWQADALTLDVTYVSRSIEQMLGYMPEACYEKSFWMNHIDARDRDRVAAGLVKLMNEAERPKNTNGPVNPGKAKETIELEFRMIAADRRVVWIHSKITFLSLHLRPTFFGLGVDITERKLAEENLQQAQAQLEKKVEDRTAELRETVSQLEAFSYSLSHDMRAPLRSIHGFSEMLREGLQDRLSTSERDLFERVIVSTGRLDRLIQDVLHYSQVARAAMEPGPIDLEKLLDTTIREYPSLQEKRDCIEVVRPLLPVMGHEASLAQCFFNLLSNALKFVPPGKKPHVIIRTEQVNRQVEVSTQDNGIGIHPEDQKRVFGIFQRFHKAPNLYEGTGIGLAIVAKAIERMGGTLGVKSGPGKGSRFWFKLPAAKS
jgi:signal transduction histidine kinase